MNSNENLYNYIKENQNEIDLERRPYINRIKEINLLLSINGYTEISDLFDTSLYSVNKTLNVIKLLLDDRLKILESKTELNKKVAKSEEDYINIIEKSEQSSLKIKELNSKIGSLKNKITLDEKKCKEETDKLKSEKNDIEKAVNRLTMKESQYKHEIRKYERDIEEYKTKFKKIFNDKDTNVNSNANKTQNFNPNLNTNLKYSSNSIKASSQMVNINDPSQNIKLPISLNSIISENEFKNSSKILHNVEHLREFYNLIFNAMNDKINHLLNQNSDMKQCYKLIYDELNQFLEYKKLFLYKFAQDSVKLNHNNSMINMKIFELDFDVGRENILQSFNEILNSFRFMLVYENLKVDPSNEFEFEEIKKIISNKKYELGDIPYYAEIKNKIESLDVNKLFELKEEIKKLGNSVTNSDAELRKYSLTKNEVDKIDKIENTPKSVLSKNQVTKLNLNIIDTLEDINKEIMDGMSLIDEKFTNLQNEMSKG